MTTDWVLVMVSRSYKVTADPIPVLKPKLVARKDPEGEHAARCNSAGSTSPMVSLAKSEEPSAFQNRMIDPVPVRATQAMSAPPAKMSERI
jgi:hypothetical protein